MSLAERVLDGLGPTFQRRAGAMLPDLVEALVAPVEQADAMVQPSTQVDARGWAAAFDARETPDPAWLANATGTRLPDGLSVDQQRDYLVGQAQARNGTVRGMQAAVRAVLQGESRRVEILERVGGDPYRWAVRVWASELPPGGITAVRRAANTQKPVGLIADAEVILVDHGASYEHLTEVHGTYAQLANRFPETEDPTVHVPEQGTTA